jgi:hypothetical protein
MIDTIGTSRRQTTHACGCDCLKCKAECCDLDCLIQPRFFCGQMLSDQDLSVLLDWVKGKTSLTRYRDGWGVVCGLDVHCASASENEAVVAVAPGYAIDCCGNDVIICNEATLDLSGCCKPPGDPCNGTLPVAAQPADGRKVTFGGWELPSSDVQAVDVLIRYKETQSDPRTGLSRGGCNGTTVCEYTRTHEDYELYCDCVEDCQDPSTQRSSDWYRRYIEGRNELLDALLALFAEGEPDRTVERLLSWLSDRPPYVFCFIRDWLCDLRRSREFPVRWFEQVVFWIVQDWRNSYLQCSCEGCGPETGVRLARVWLWRRRDSRGKERSSVVYINPYPPFRRPIATDCWPAPADHVSLARFIWQTRETSCAPLRALGFTDISFERFEYSDVAHLNEQLRRESLFVRCSDRTEAGGLTAYYYLDYCNQSRIVSFRPREATTTDTKQSRPDDAATGSKGGAEIRGRRR